MVPGALFLLELKNKFSVITFIFHERLEFKSWENVVLKPLVPI